MRDWFLAACGGLLVLSLLTLVLLFGWYSCRCIRKAERPCCCPACPQ
jgi:hypothetical protein